MLDQWCMKLAWVFNVVVSISIWSNNLENATTSDFASPIQLRSKILNCKLLGDFVIWTL